MSEGRALGGRTQNTKLPASRKEGASRVRWMGRGAVNQARAKALWQQSVVEAGARREGVKAES